MPKWHDRIWTVEDAIFRAWKLGRGVGAAVLSVKRLTGQTVTKEHVLAEFQKYGTDWRAVAQHDPLTGLSMSVDGRRNEDGTATVTIDIGNEGFEVRLPTTGDWYNINTTLTPDENGEYRAVEPPSVTRVDTTDEV